jgi:hypothetical protein
LGGVVVVDHAYVADDDHVYVKQFDVDVTLTWVAVVKVDRRRKVYLDVDDRWGDYDPRR